LHVFGKGWKQLSFKISTIKYPEIVQLLRRYKSNKAKIQLYNIEIEGLEEMLGYGNNYVLEDVNQCIEGICMRAKTVTDIPVSHDNQFQSSTEKAALSYHDERVWKPEDSFNIRSRIKEIKSRMYRLEMEVRQVDAMLTVLGKMQRFIIEQYYIEGCKWPEIAEQIELNFKQAYALNTLYAWRDKALEKMGSVFLKCG